MSRLAVFVLNELWGRKDKMGFGDQGLVLLWGSLFSFHSVYSQEQVTLHQVNYSYWQSTICQYFFPL